ncbi:carboxypeptidase regulatory-like domain-containing protein [Georgenia yuyongxinii]
MRVLSTTDVLDVAPGGTGEIPIDVVNTGAVIDGVSARVIGLPAEHVTTHPAVLPLFPDASGRLVVRLDLPGSFPAGTHPVTVEVGGQAGSVLAHHDVDVVVAARPALSLTAVPSTVRGRRRVLFDVAVRNTGNMALDVVLQATDSDRSVQCALIPSAVRVEPGAVGHCVAEVRGPRHLVGAEINRPLRVTGTADELAESVALVYRQRPTFSRGLLTALVLFAIVGAWAAIFLVGLFQVLGADPLTKTAPASFFAATAAAGATEADGAAPAGAVARDGVLPAGVGGSLTGTVVGATDGEGVGRITVDALRRGRDGLVLVGSAATQSDGTYEVAGLFPGSYVLRFSADGFDALWYPAAPDEGGARPVTAEAQGVTEGLDVALTGQPGQIAGTVDVGDVAEPVETTVVARAVWAPEGEEITAETVAGADGSYILADLPAPGSYELTFTAEGYAPTTITERITGGQERFAPRVRLGADAGQISGTVTDGSAPIGGVSVTTTVGDAEVAVGTPTVGQVGTFLIPGLPTPGTYVVTFEMEGYTPATVVVDLIAGQSRTGLDVILQGGAGTVTGKVSGPDGAGLGGVAVTAGGAETSVEATTLTTGDVGSFTLAGLAPEPYTLTFALDGYQSVSVPVDLAGGPPPAVQVTLQPALGRIDGVVRSGRQGVVGVEVQATDGRQVWTTTTTTRPGTGPGGGDGYYLVADLPPGTYTVSVAQGGRVVATALVPVTAGTTAGQDLGLRG